MKAIFRTSAAGVLWAIPLVATAGCGVAFCTLNTDWSAHAPWQNDSTLIDVRAEYIHQDQVRSGTRKSVDSGHHQELETTNLNTWVAVSHAFSRDLNVSLQLPLIARSHEHIHHHHGAQLPEQWDFTRLGDVRLLAHQRLDGDHGGISYGVLGGIKLPTGSTRVRNGEGDTAERSLQPGSGSTDLIAGSYASAPIGQANGHVQLRWQHAVTARQDFRPGDPVGVDAGLRMPLGPVHALVQINLLWRDRDQGANAEPTDSGGRFVYVSPGVALSLGKQTQIYGLIQLPLYQKVNGTQLTSDWAATMGLTARF